MPDKSELDWYSATLLNASTKDWAYVEIKATSKQDALNKLSRLVCMQASGGDVQINNLRPI